MPRIRLVVAWYDFWIGAYWDRRTHQLYLLPVPCLGICLAFKRTERPASAFPQPTQVTLTQTPRTHQRLPASLHDHPGSLR